MRTQPQALRAVECSEHGKTRGTTAGIDQGGLRCNECGRFAKPAVGYCAKHGVNWGDIGGYDHCPKCREERRIEEERQEIMSRRADPNMHNMVDAQANAIDHSRSPSDFI